MDMKVNTKIIILSRQQRAWSQQHLADASAVSLRTVQRVENTGKASPETIKSIAAALDKPVTALLLPIAQDAPHAQKREVRPEAIRSLSAFPNPRWAWAACFGLLTLAITAMLPATAEDLSLRAKKMTEGHERGVSRFEQSVEIRIPDSADTQISAKEMWQEGPVQMFKGQVKIVSGSASISLNRAAVIQQDDYLVVYSEMAEMSHLPEAL